MSTKRKIGGCLLLVEDEPDIRQLLSLTLASLIDSKIIEAANGEEALACKKLHDVEVIVSDISMPVMGGFEFFKKLREAKDMTPVIFLTGFSDGKTEQELLKLGAFDFIQKPCPSHHLVVLIEDAFHSSRKLREMLKSSPNIQNSTPMLPSVKAENSDLRDLVIGYCHVMATALSPQLQTENNQALTTCLQATLYIQTLAEKNSLSQLVEICRISTSLLGFAINKKGAVQDLQTLRYSFETLLDKLKNHKGTLASWCLQPEWQDLLSSLKKTVLLKAS